MTLVVINNYVDDNCVVVVVYKPFNLIQDEVFEFDKDEVGEGKGDKVQSLFTFECSLQSFCVVLVTFFLF